MKVNKGYPKVALYYSKAETRVSVGWWWWGGGVKPNFTWVVLGCFGLSWGSVVIELWFWQFTQVFAPIITLELYTFITAAYQELPTRLTPTPVCDMFCRDTEYYPAVKAGDIPPVIHNALPQLDGCSVYSPSPPSSSLSSQLYSSDLGWDGNTQVISRSSAEVRNVNITKTFTLADFQRIVADSSNRKWSFRVSSSLIFNPIIHGG